MVVKLFLTELHCNELLKSLQSLGKSQVLLLIERQLNGILHSQLLQGRGQNTKP
jgi:hypothetical protein